jgi:hypothetical protein
LCPPDKTPVFILITHSGNYHAAVVEEVTKADVSPQQADQYTDQGIKVVRPHWLNILGNFHPPEETLSDTILGMKYGIWLVLKEDNSECYRRLRASLPDLLLIGLILRKWLAQDQRFTPPCLHSLYQFLWLPNLLELGGLHYNPS